MIPETAIVIKGQAGGLALVRKYGREHLREVGKKGGRPRAFTAFTINDADTYIYRYIAPAAQIKEERRHGKGLKELLGLWKEKWAGVILARNEANCQAQENQPAPVCILGGKK